MTTIPTTTVRPLTSPYSMLRGLFILLGIYVLMFIVVVLATQVINALITPATRENLLAAVCTQTVLLFGIPSVLTAAIVSGKKFPSFLGIDKSYSLRSLIGAMAIFLLAMPALNQIILYNSEMHLPWTGVEEMLRAWEDAAQKSTEVLLSTRSVGGLISGVMVIGVVTGICEELFFRGTVQRLMTSAGVNGHLAVWTAALIFSIAHMQFYGFFPRMLLGAFFGYMMLWSGSLWLSATLHVVNNSLVVIFSWLALRGFFTDDLEAFGTTPSFPWLPIVSAVGVVVILFFFHSRLFAPARKSYDAQRKEK